MNCSVDEFRIYRGRLAPDEIQALDVIGPSQLLLTNPSLTVQRNGGNVGAELACRRRWLFCASGFVA